jgi:acyl-CoA hydrolase
MKSSKKLIPQSPRDSQVTMTEIVLPGHTNALGGIFGGVVMSWIDIAGAIASSRHSGQVCVTASVDELHFLKPIRKGFIVNITAIVTYVATTSCEVCVEVTSENPIAKEKTFTTRAFLTFVAIDSQGTPIPMPPLKLETPEEKKRFKAGELRRNHRQALKQKLAQELTT